MSEEQQQPRDGEYHVPVAVTFADGEVESIELSGEGAPWMYSADPNFASAYMEIPEDDQDPPWMDEFDWVTPTFDEHLRTDKAVNDALKRGMSYDPEVELALSVAFMRIKIGNLLTSEEMEALTGVLCNANLHVASMAAYVTSEGEDTNVAAE